MAFHLNIDLTPRQKKIVKWVGYVVLAFMTFLFALSHTFPYQRLEGKIAEALAKKYDVEVWAAGCREWLEVSSASNCEAFQARRANVRYRPADGGRPRFVHTLNASGLALPRIMIAIIENYQQADGTIQVPTALQPYLGGMKVIG